MIRRMNQKTLNARTRKSRIFTFRWLVPYIILVFYWFVKYDQDLDLSRQTFQDLKLPKWKDSRTQPDTTVTLSKFGFLEMLEEIFGQDLRKDNPWFNRLPNKRTFKKVRFNTFEIFTNELPHCRRHDCRVKDPGQLHASSCSNSQQETLEVLGSNTWQNRVFILECCRQKTWIM